MVQTMALCCTPAGDLPNQNQATSSMEMETHTNHMRKASLEQIEIVTARAILLAIGSTR